MHAGEELPNIPLKGSELTFDLELFYETEPWEGEIKKNHIELDHTEWRGMGVKMIILTIFSEEFYPPIFITVMLNTFSNIFNM